MRHSLDRLRARLEIGDELVPRLDGRALRPSYACRHGKTSSIVRLGFEGRMAPLLARLRGGEHGMDQERQSPRVGIDKRERRNRRGIGPHHAGAERDRQDKGLSKRSALSSSSNPPSGPISTASGRCGFALRARQAARRWAPPHRQRSSSRFSSQPARRAPSFSGSATSGTKDAALLGGLDGIGGEPRSY